MSASALNMWKMPRIWSKKRQVTGRLNAVFNNEDLNGSFCRAVWRMLLCTSYIMLDDRLLEEKTILTWQPVGNVTRGCERTAVKPTAHTCLWPPAWDRQDSSLERGMQVEGGFSPAQGIPPPLSSFAQRCAIHTHPLSFPQLVFTWFLPSSESLLLPVEVLHFKTPSFMQERQEKMSYASSLKKKKSLDYFPVPGTRDLLLWFIGNNLWF